MLELSRSRPNVVKLDPRDLRWPIKDQLFENILTLAQEHAWRKVKLDFRRVDVISGAGLGKLVALYLELKAHGMRLVIENVDDFVYEVFKVTGLTRVLDVRKGKGPGAAR